MKRSEFLSKLFIKLGDRRQKVLNKRPRLSMLQREYISEIIDIAEELGMLPPTVTTYSMQIPEVSTGISRTNEWEPEGERNNG